MSAGVSVDSVTPEVARSSIGMSEAVQCATEESSQ